jgi:hypothetical protein
MTALKIILPLGIAAVIASLVIGFTTITLAGVTNCGSGLLDHLAAPQRHVSPCPKREAQPSGSTPSRWGEMQYHQLRILCALRDKIDTRSGMPTRV